MDLVGKMLAGRYEIIEEVGKGGMANVYKAQDHFLNRFVAVKVLKEELRDDKEFVHRFNTEAQAAARISNPHVVSIYDVGFENGLYYIVMEFVEGITLKEYIEKKHALPWKEAAGFAAQICDGLDAAHKQSVIHRDIKPQNIIMTADNVLKVTDFGIARATSQATTTNSSSTIGTVHYLSPEQARGGYTNEKTDIYSLGVVLYEMLTGRLPFNDSTAVAIAIKHIQEKPILPRILNNDIPESMEYIVMKAMNKEQNLRYASAEEFLSDLKKVIANPNAKLKVREVDDIEATRKRDAIGSDEIESYERNKRTDKKEYEKYAEQMDREMEARRLRNLDRKQAIKAQKKKERRITIAAVLAAILVIAGLGFAFSALSGGSITSLFTGAEKVEIPNVIDMKLTDAQKKYKSEGFSIVKKSERASDKEAGVILEQDPPAGNSVTKKSDIIINVVVSAGSQNKTVEDYTKMKSDDAKKKVEASGFKVNIVEQESSSVEKGEVISQMPVSGTSVSEGALITLYVSTGDAKKDDKEEKNKSNEDKVSKPSGTESNNSSNNTSGNNSTNTGSNNTPSNNTNNSASGNGTTQTPSNSGTGSEGSGNSGSTNNSGTSNGGTTNALPGVSN